MTLRPQHILALVLAVTTIAATGDASAARAEHRLGVGAPVGVGGKFKSIEAGETSAEFDGEEANMQVSYGLFLQYEYVPIKYLAVGLRPTFLAYQTKGESENELGRNYAVNFDLLLQLQLPFGDDDLVYVALPVGPALTIPSNDYEDLAGVLGLEADPALAWNLSALLGVELQGDSKDPGLFIEAGYAYQRTNYHVPGDLAGLLAVDTNAKGAFWQIGLSAGITFGL